MKGDVVANDLVDASIADRSEPTIGSNEADHVRLRPVPSEFVPVKDREAVRRETARSTPANL
ncbi:hypothetical protein BH11MYX1_BH11MYX1_22720 [soil metagenome]